MELLYNTFAQIHIERHVKLYNTFAQIHIERHVKLCQNLKTLWTCLISVLFSVSTGQTKSYKP